jgi:hypothetical protein
MSQTRFTINFPILTVALKLFFAGYVEFLRANNSICFSGLWCCTHLSSSLKRHTKYHSLQLRNVEVGRRSDHLSSVCFLDCYFGTNLFNAQRQPICYWRMPQTLLCERFNAIFNCFSDERVSVRNIPLMSLRKVFDVGGLPLLSSSMTFIRPFVMSRHHLHTCWANEDHTCNMHGHNLPVDVQGSRDLCPNE